MQELITDIMRSTKDNQQERLRVIATIERVVPNFDIT